MASHVLKVYISLFCLKFKDAIRIFQFEFPARLFSILGYRLVPTQFIVRPLLDMFFIYGKKQLVG